MTTSTPRLWSLVVYSIINAAVAEQETSQKLWSETEVSFWSNSYSEGLRQGVCRISVSTHERPITSGDYHILY